MGSGWVSGAAASTRSTAGEPSAVFAAFRGMAALSGKQPVSALQFLLINVRDSSLLLGRHLD